MKLNFFFKNFFRTLKRKNSLFTGIFFVFLCKIFFDLKKYFFFVHKSTACVIEKRSKKKIFFTMASYLWRGQQPSPRLMMPAIDTMVRYATHHIPRQLAARDVPNATALNATFRVNFDPLRLGGGVALAAGVTIPGWRERHTVHNVSFCCIILYYIILCSYTCLPTYLSACTCRWCNESDA